MPSIEESAGEFREQRAAYQSAWEAEEARKKAEALAEINHRKARFNAHMASFGDEIEVLAAQAQQLHGIFAQAVDEYIAAGERENKAKLHSAIALKAQNYCRMTLTAMARMKEQHAKTTITREKKKIEDPAIQKRHYEPMDAGIAPQAGGIDPQMATLEDNGDQNR